jgi:hypothetical protein
VKVPASASQTTGSRHPYSRAQAHPGPHWHCGPQGQAAFGAAGCIGRLWQPQAQPWPGQSVQVHGVSLVASIAFLLWLKMQGQFRRASAWRIERNG